MILTELYNDDSKETLNVFLKDYITQIGQKEKNSNYLLSNVYDDDGLENNSKCFLVNLNNELKIIDVCVQKKIYNTLTNVIFDVTYGNVFNSTNTPFILDSCFFRLYFDLSNNKIINEKPYNIEFYYTSVFSDNLNEVIL